MSGTKVFNAVRNTRFIIGALVIFGIVTFLIASPGNVSEGLSKSKLGSIDLGSTTNSPVTGEEGEPLYPPSPNQPQTGNDGEVIGNSPQYADDSIDSKKPTTNDDDSKEKIADVNTPKEAPKPKMNEKAPIKGEFDAIKDSNRVYEGVPDKDSDSNSDSNDVSNDLSNDLSDSKKESTQNVANCKKDPEYVVMIDAGSTGSRVHIYEFDVCYSPPKLNKEEFEMLKPGLSSFDTDTTGAAKSLDPLLELALKTVPESKRSCTPVAVKATAGLRLLGEEKSKNILAAVRKHLENDYPFAVVEGDGVSIMSGDDEGVYAWITANYLLGNIGSSAKTPTAAVFDLGGGSTQIVFQPDFKNGEKMIDGQHKYEINFGNRDFSLYQFSHLGYGLMAGREKINSLIVKAGIKDGKVKKDSKATLESPCIPPGLSVKDVKVKVDDVSYTVDLKGSETPAGAQCRFLAESILNKDAACDKAPCSFNGVHQPSLVKTFHETSDLYVFSYFYDRTNPLGLPSSFTLGELSDLAKNVCNGESVWASTFSAIDGSIKELKDEPQWCLDLSFQVALLHTGYDIPLHRELRTAKKIADNELGWCLGASLPLLDKTTGGWKCRVKEVAKN
ncbi:Guanosine-diphosphatase [Wickerhamomyces ciferrii]|uniref:guanosine-diphosphatase n=1 Tax=Wickerhamomyces ciferrii (strain ATCC 14091 / BCRC 22168 / CBS 111 / JCM 3599 / NBRC 0793 / NRRL Y-1031 F-60-10) TaxID=1206466 RepID=K0KWT5_WICCF|nr:Guanosine-diphosphatase [Wickerhamomyces ciferrii]CCH45954.1 Guanosine-diphosphatase [Wickerhamomyces ciferrii]